MPIIFIIFTYFVQIGLGQENSPYQKLYEAKLAEVEKEMQDQLNHLASPKEVAMWGQKEANIQKADDLSKLSPEILESRDHFILVPKKAGGQVRSFARLMSALLGGEVEIKDDLKGEFFDPNGQLRQYARKRTRFFYESENEYEDAGAWLLEGAQKVFSEIALSYGVMKDFGIQNLQISFEEEGWLTSSKIKVSGDTLKIIVAYNIEEMPKGSVTEYFDGSKLSGKKYMNWHKQIQYREYDQAVNYVELMKIYSQEMDWTPRTMLAWITRKAPLYSGVSFKPLAITITPSPDPMIQNRNLDMIIPRESTIEYALIQDKGNRDKHDYPESFILKDVVAFASAMLELEQQRVKGEKIQTQQIVAFDEMLRKKGIDPSKISKERKWNAIAMMKMGYL